MGGAASLCCDALGLASSAGGGRVESSYTLEGKRYVRLALCDARRSLTPLR